MRILTVVCSAGLGLAVAGCSQVPNAGAGTGVRDTGVRSDTGGMAYPEPRATGEFQRPAQTGVDTGGMAYPSFRRPGVAVPASQDTGVDTGSAAYQTPRGVGNVPTNTAR